MKNKKALIPLLIVAFLVVFVFVNRFRTNDSNSQGTGREPTENYRERSKGPLSGIKIPNRKVIYTKHAKCRMACRQIDESEISELLANGKLNNSKSSPSSRPDPRYAIEGRTDDGQQVRLIVAVAERGLVLVTVIDLQKEWSCNCK